MRKGDSDRGTTRAARMAMATLHVLVVDDDESSRGLLQVLLETLDYRVETAATGEAALTRLATEPLPDAVLMDVVMSGLDGLETLRRYRDAGGHDHVVVSTLVPERDRD